MHTPWFYMNLNCLISHSNQINLSTVSGEPFPDPRGRLRIGGGINVPIALETSTTEYKAMEIKRALTLNGLICSVKKS